MKIRTANKKDIATIAEIHRNGEVYMNQQFQDDDLGNYPLEDFINEWKNRIEPYSDHAVLVLEDEGSVQGVASYCVLEGEYTSELVALYIDVTKIGYGYGTQLLDVVENNLKDMDFEEIGLSTPQGNELGIHFYENKGFIPSGENCNSGGISYIGFQKKL